MRRLALAVLLMAGAPALGASAADGPAGAASARSLAPAVVEALEAAARAELARAKA
jgi:hypothetical protein